MENTSNQSQTSISIDKNIDLPRRDGKKPHYPFDSLEVGDSFFISASELIYGVKLQTKLSIAAYMYRQRKQNGRMFATRQLENGVRVWRTV